MGDRWHLLLEDLQIDGGKNSIPSRLMTVFQEEDKYMHVEWARHVDEINARPHDDDASIDSFLEDFDTEETNDLFGYQAPVRTIVTRLDLMGFTAERCKREMQECVAELLAYDGEDSIVVYDNLGREASRYDISAAEIVNVGLSAHLKRSTRGSVHRPKLTDLEERCIKYVDLLFETDEDPRLLLGALLDGQDPEKRLRLDLSDLLHAGYFTSDGELSAQALQELREETSSTGPIIVITEGKFDSRVLGRALRIVRPDIAGYFKFWDLGTTKAPGGTDRVVANLRSFAAAGVMNRVIGLVDNDAAGLAAEKQLRSTPLPKHYSICRLPNLDYAHSYPTHGPSGKSEDDINGRACSIEFYFGTDCLQGPDNELIPVRWKALNDAVQEWQGELSNKPYVQARIEALLDKTESGVAVVDGRWDPMRGIANALVQAAQSRYEPAPPTST
ncbi:HEPN/Toprim-associated domain-containing protein [Microtetraspora malaysiensis]|uniref:HEPN/Toprim-associated domain-containing protein n=1 Tax=Microtetraspora malaysiensis TaxID=161358 RepID=UPI003D9063F3